MDDKQEKPFVMLTDPILLFASKNGGIDPKLVEICLANKTAWDVATASRSFEVVRQAAEAGSAFAMCMCYGFSLAGWGQSKSNQNAFKWAKKAAAEAFAPGYFLLGQCYEHGTGVSPDIEQARHYYELAANGGFGASACHLSTLYHAGRVGPPNIVKALEYAILAYQLGDPMAPLLIAGWYEQGQGVIRNEREAVSWYVRAADIGNFFASDRLSKAYEYGELGLQKDADLANKFRLMFDRQLPPVQEHSENISGQSSNNP